MWTNRKSLVLGTRYHAGATPVIPIMKTCAKCNKQFSRIGTLNGKPFNLSSRRIHCLECSPFGTNGIRTKSWTDDQLIEAVKNSKSFAEAIRHLGLSPHGNTNKTLKKHIERLKLSTEHFQIYNKVRNNFLLKYKLEDIFTENSPVARATARRYLLRYQLIPYRCADTNCSLTYDDKGFPVWGGKNITLQLEHKNGKSNDYRLTNLCWLCPNCHSQTDTYAGKSASYKLSYKKITVAVRETNPLAAQHTCQECKKEFKPEKRTQKFCTSQCAKASKRKVKGKLSKDLLEKLLWEKPATTVCKDYGVSSNALKKLAREYGIDTPPRGYWAKVKAGKIGQQTGQASQGSLES